MGAPRKPDYLEDMSNLEPGDILLFRPCKESSLIQSGIILLQYLTGHSSGHSDTTHAAVCTGKVKDKDGNNMAMIAHITDTVMGYKQEPLKDKVKQDGGDRAFIVFRHKDRQIAEKLAAVSANEKHNTIKWKAQAAIGALLETPALDPARTRESQKEFAKDSICSKFVIQAMKVAMQSTPQYYPNIRSTTTPKALESYLYNDDNYEMFVCPGKTNPFTLVEGEILNQIGRIGLRKDTRSQIKACKLQEVFNTSVAKLNANTTMNELEKAKELIKATSALLMENTGYNLKEAGSYRAVINAARTIGIFEKELQSDTVTAENKKSL